MRHPRSAPVGYNNRLQNYFVLPATVVSVTVPVAATGCVRIKTSPVTGQTYQCNRLRYIGRTHHCRDCQRELLQLRCKYCPGCKKELSFEQFSTSNDSNRRVVVTHAEVTGFGQLHGMCKPCTSQQVVANRRQNLLQFIRHARRGAIHHVAKRKIAFDADTITVEYLYDLFVNQLDQRCYYTRLPLTQIRQDPYMMSLERINTDKRQGYVPGNVTFCMYALNGSRQWSVTKLTRMVYLHSHDWLPVDHVDFANWAIRLTSSFGTLRQKQQAIKDRMQSRCVKLHWLQRLVYACHNSCRSRNVWASTRNQQTTEIDLLWLVERLVMQQFRCAYSGIYLRLQSKTDWQLSPDRQDNAIGYTSDNVVLVCLEFNMRAKWNKNLVQQVITATKQLPDVSRKEF